MTRGNVSELLGSYPRDRPPLTEEHKRVYVEEYKRNRGGRGLLYGTIKRLESWGHRKVARLSHLGPVLEIGAGSLNHLSYEEDVEVYDCVEPFAELFEGSPHRDRVRTLYSSIADVPPEPQYARVISIATLEHLQGLPEIIARSGLLLRPGGVFQGVIPSEGGFVWGASWRCTTGIAYKLRTGLSYGTLMRHEHVNDAVEIIRVTDHFFQDLRIHRFPLPFHHASFYTYIEAHGCETQRCADYLFSMGASFQK